MKNKNDMGVLNRNERKRNQKKLIIYLCIAIIIITIILFAIIKFKNHLAEEKKKADIETIIKEKQTKVIYVMNSDPKKCADCKELRKSLDEQKINYLIYDVSDYSEQEYKNTLQKLTIKEKDFGYPAIIYIKDGKLYSNMINLNSSKLIDKFIKDYDLNKIK